jgi:polyhydroxyalkanoate synthesis repressor PhaR
MNEPVLIKRYANRKLYDQSQSRYVTLEELAELIRQGRQIRVVDAVSGDDLTSLTLAQIILESERDRRSFLPTSFLHQLIQHGETWQDFVRQSLEASLTGVVATQREAERILKDWSARAGWWPAGAASDRAPRADRQAKPGEDMDDLRAEVAALKARLRELETRLGR